MRRIGPVRMFVGIVMLAVTLAAPATLSAAIIGVTDCGDNGAAGQLRTLIRTVAPGDTIVIPACTITLTAGSLLVSKNVSLQGRGAGATIIDGARIDRVITVSTDLRVEVSDLTIQNGQEPTSFTGIGGGGLSIGQRSRLTLANARITGNDGASGGGVFVDFSGALTAINTLIDRNSASRNGGGIFSFGVVRLVDSRLTDNTAEFGGGIETFVGEAFGFLTVTGTAITRNVARVTGGGIYGSFGRVILEKSVIADNRAFQGGGIWIGGTLDARGVTISGNKTTFGGAGLFVSVLGTPVLESSTISENSDEIEGGGILNLGTLALTKAPLRNKIVKLPSP